MRYKIKFLSAEKIKKITSGEVLEPKLLNKKTLLPVVGGLFCPKIFGPLHDFTCLCSDDKKVHFKDRVCPKCGVQYVIARQRRDRSGYIRLATPHLHPLAIGILAQILRVDSTDLEQLVNGLGWLGWEASAEAGSVIVYGQNTKVSVSEKHSEETRERSSIGLYSLVEKIDILRTHELHLEAGWDISATFMEKCIKENIRLTDLFITLLPVMPPDLRPIIHKGPKTLTTPKNDLYRNFMWRKNRLQYTKDLRWAAYPPLLKKDLIQEEAIQAQQAMLKLLISGFESIHGDPMKSLLQDLSGKGGHVRNKMLGKRVDYSGRTVITPGPHLSVNDISIPRKIGVALFDPWIVEYISTKYHYTIKRINKLRLRVRTSHRPFDHNNPLIYEALDEVIKDKVVIMNRQPTLHRMGMLCFNVRLHDGNSVLLHPMVCAPFNADFDGDQMAIHVPVSLEGIEETKHLLYPGDNLLSPADGNPIIMPSHEMIIGLYDMTNIKEGAPHVCLSKEKAIEAYDRELLRIDSPVDIRTPARLGGGIHRSCVGRLLVEALFHVNIEEPLTKKSLRTLISKAYGILGKQQLAVALDQIKEIAYNHVSAMGFSLGMDDFVLPSTRGERMTEAISFSQELSRQYSEGLINEDERVERKIRKWMETIDALQKDFIKEAGENNPLVIMLKTGARVSMTQVSQLVVAKGMQASAKGKIIEDPIQSCLATKLGTFEFFMSSYGARKSMADKKMATPRSGFLARRLVNAARDLYISEEDCGYYNEGVEIRRRDAIGRTTITGEVIEKNISNSYVTVRSPIFCHATNGICAVCYGLDLSKRSQVTLGTPVGVIAAQSLTEPCTQLTMRSFHTSGAAELKDSPLVIRSAIKGMVFMRKTSDKTLSICVDDLEYMVHESLCSVLVQNNQIVEIGTPIAIYTSKNLANEDISGKLVLLESYYEAKKPRLHAAVIAKEAGEVDLKIETEKDEETEEVRTKISLYISGKFQGDVTETPIFVASGELVRKGQILTYGEVNLRDYEDMSCVANVFVQRLQYLYEQEGLLPSSVHLEVIFRAMTELVLDEETREIGLFRVGDLGQRLILGVTEIGKMYPSWLKRISFGYTKQGLTQAATNFEISRDLPSERILGGKYPLFDIPKKKGVTNA